MLKDLQAMIQGHMCEEDVETLDIDLPLQTMEQLDETERYLENDGAQKRMVKTQFVLSKENLCTCYLVHNLCITFL